MTYFLQQCMLVCRISDTGWPMISSLIDLGQNLCTDSKKAVFLQECFKNIIT